MFGDQRANRLRSLGIILDHTDDAGSAVGPLLTERKMSLGLTDTMNALATGDSGYSGSGTVTAVPATTPGLRRPHPNNRVAHAGNRTGKVQGSLSIHPLWIVGLVVAAWVVLKK